MSYDTYFFFLSDIDVSAATKFYNNFINLIFNTPAQVNEHIICHKAS